MRKIIFVSIFFFCFSAGAWASKEGQVKQGNNLYQKGDYGNSLKHYEKALKNDAESPVINFNLGTALYKSGRYDDAVSSLQKGLLSNDPLLKKNAHFNLGDVFYGQGKQKAKQNIDEAIKAMEESLRQFEAVMNLDDKDQDARYNYDIVKKELEQLKKNKEEQKNNRQKKQDQDQSQSSSDQNSDKQDQQKNQDHKSSASNDDKKKSESSQENKDEKKDDKQKLEDKKQQESSSKQDAQNKDAGKKDSINASAPQPGEMTKDEAKALLKQFKQDEEPSGLLNLQKSSEEERPVLKDW